jgi:hypothetical protein
VIWDVTHAVERFVLHSAPTTALICIATFGLVAVSSKIICPILAFWPWRSVVFLLIFRWFASIRVDAVNLSVRCVKT